MQHPGRLSLIAAASLALASTQATAQPRGNPPDATAVEEPSPGSNPTSAFQQAEARSHFQTGVEHYQARRFTDAIREFQTAYRLMASPTILFNLAQAYRGDQQLSNAISTFRRYIDENPRLTPEQRADVEGVIREIEDNRAILRFEVEPSGAEISLDGRSVGAAPVARAVELLPGTHDVEITLDNHEPRRETINVHAHEQRLYTATLRAVERNARLVVAAVPAGATIRVDGEPHGTGTADLRVAPGEHTVEVSLAGYTPRTERVNVRRLSTENVTVNLDARPTPIYARWWFWTAIGVAVAGGVTLGVVLNPSTPDPRPGNGTPGYVQTLASW